MKIKVSEATGAALNWLVEQCEMMRPDYRDSGLLIHRVGYGLPTPKYSTEFAHGGPIIEREITGVDLVSEWKNVKKWSARKFEYLPNDQTRCTEQQGSTLLVAAMRCYVASKIGDCADVPEELTDA